MVSFPYHCGILGGHWKSHWSKRKTHHHISGFSTPHGSSTKLDCRFRADCKDVATDLGRWFFTGKFHHFFMAGKNQTESRLKQIKSWIKVTNFVNLDIVFDMILAIFCVQKNNQKNKWYYGGEKKTGPSGPVYFFRNDSPSGHSEISTKRRDVGWWQPRRFGWACLFIVWCKRNLNMTEKQLGGNTCNLSIWYIYIYQWTNICIYIYEGTS